MSSSNADWDSVTVIGQRAGSSKATVARSSSAINAARRSGGVIDTEKKYTGGQNKAHTSTEGQRIAKIANETDVVPPPKIDITVGKAMARARQEKKMSQKDLAAKVNEKPNVINDYESGRAVPNQALLGKIERALGVKLRGKAVGEPLGGPKKK